MALRSIDNKLPAAVERSKKQVKIADTFLKEKKPQKPEFGVNDENQLPFPPASTDVSIDYIPSEDLKAFEDPEVKIQSLVGGLESKDWLKLCDSLNDVRRLAIHHPTLLLPFLEKVVVVMVNGIKNPRSALCKTSIMASSDVFRALGEKLLGFTDDSAAFNNLLLQLLLKASQDKKFVCEEADKAMKAMVESTAPLPLLQKLETYVGHSNLKVRAKAAISISNCVSKMEAETMKEYGLVALIQIASNLLNDKLPEAREAARSIVLSLFEAFTGDKEEKVESWQTFCQSSLPTTYAQAMIKLVSS